MRTGRGLPAVAVAGALVTVLAACGGQPITPAGPGVNSPVVPGPADGGIYRTVTGSEHADPGRSRSFPDAVFGGSLTAPDRNRVVVRTSPLRYPGPYNLVTRVADELFVYFGSYGGVDGADGPAVARLDPRTLQEVWRTTVSVVEPGAWNYPGVLGVHGNGSLHVVAANGITRIDPETGAIQASADLPTTDFQTNGGRSTAPMTVWTVSLADSARRFSLTPFAAGTGDESLQIAAMVVDPVGGRVFPNDLLAGRLAALDADPAGGFRPVWGEEQTTFSFGALVGGPGRQVLVMTDLTGVLAGINPLAARREQVVFRDAGTGAELARTGDLPRMSGGANIAPGFSGQVYYPAEDGTIHELTVVDAG